MGPRPHPSADAGPAGGRATRDAIRDVWGARTPHAGSLSTSWPAREDVRVLDEPDHWVHSVCVLCSTGCGLDIGVRDGRMVGVRGRVR